jgi:PEP-CTERM motif
MKTLKHVLAAAFTVLAGSAIAAPITSNPTFTNDSLTFSDFTCHITKGGIFATPDKCSQIDVSGNITPAKGLDIKSSFVAAPLSFDDAVLTYHVHAKAGAISAIELDFDGFFQGLAIASVTETVKDNKGHIVGYLQVSCSTFACERQDPPYEAFDIPLSGTYTDLYITKDINVTGVLGFASTSYIHQGYTVEVPEPGPLALLGTGLLGIGLFGRRKREAA